MTNKNAFGRSERLSGRKQIETLFNAGISFNVSPFKIFFTVEETGRPVEIRILVAVPKKKFKHAVDRNRVKRKIREAYRLNKSYLLNNLVTQTLSLNIGFIYIDPEKDPASAVIHKAMVTCLEKMARTVNTGLTSDSNSTVRT
jgi:ribonuclease P protein component